MKIALFTIWHEMNYGAELQMYATIKALQSLNHEVELVDIQLSDLKTHTLKSRIYDFLLSLGPGYRKMNSFWSKIPKTKHYNSFSDLQNNPPKADVYLVGSDQVWNDDIVKNYLKVFFLDIGSENTKRLSYASSFGKSLWDGKNTEEIKSALNKFVAISCRETEGVDILYSVFGKKSELVVDPTLLHQDYVKLTGPLGQNKPYLVYYPLDEFHQMEEFAQRLSVHLSLKFININYRKKILKKIPWNFLGIEEWVKTIAESSFVVTPSFHGVVFSIIYRKQFIFIVNHNGINRISRITNLLENLGLSERICLSVDDGYKKELWLKKIDYDKVYSKLDILKKKSWDFLQDSLHKCE